ncbi:MAG: hypothetical protein HND51_17475 [Chloroflexi bacterium]|nr:hypothetical protein [Chloroflexota bacterium]
MKKLFLPALVLLMFACQIGAPPATDTPPPSPTVVQPTTPPEPSPQPTEVPVIPKDISINVTGEEELVFDWTTDRCEPDHIPDIATRAFRDADGMVQLWIGHYVNYRMIGPDLNNLESDCTVLMNSDYDPDPSQFNDSEWLAALYTEDGETIYAIMHNEYRGDTHTATRPGQCPSGDRLTCLDTSVTMAISTDGGDSFYDILEPPNHMVATMPYVFNDEGVPSGLRQPSNIIKGPDDYFYVFTNISDYPVFPGDFPPQWVCAMRTDDLSDPSSWRFWNGEDFTGQFVNPYVEELGPSTPKCAPLAVEQLTGGIQESIVYSSTLERYVMVGFTNPPTGGTNLGYYYSLSEDLIHWTPRELILELPGTYTVEDNSKDLFYAYPTLLDPDSQSLNFDTVDDQFYLYITRFNQGITLDRDLVRFPLELTVTDYPAPEPWLFDTDGDLEGWFPYVHLEDFAVQDGSLSMRSTGEDPHMGSPLLTVVAVQNSKITIEMKVSPGEQSEGQLFFITDSDGEWGEAKSVFFPVIADGEFHTYELDMSTIEGWQGIVTQIRLDPLYTPDSVIEIDSIVFVN